MTPLFFPPALRESHYERFFTMVRASVVTVVVSRRWRLFSLFDCYAYPALDCLRNQLLLPLLTGFMLELRSF